MPRHNPNHIAIRSNSVVRGSVVAFNGGMIELQTGLRGTLNGSCTYTTLPTIGPAITATASGAYVSFSGLPKSLSTSENTITLALIFRFTNTSVARAAGVATSTLLNKGYSMGARNSQVYIAMPGQNEASVTAFPNLTSGRYYFLAWSPGSPGPVVLTDMTSGVIMTTTVTLSGALFNTDGVMAVGVSPSTSGAEGPGSYAAAAWIAGSTPQAALQAWAADPWSFWYS
jgi:hypothetical protein